MKKKVLCSILSGAFVLASLTPLYAATNDISVFINNSQVTFDTQPQIINDSTFVPMRKIFEELGASVEWNDSDKSIKATKDSKVVTLYIDKTYCEVDGKKQETGIAPQIIDSRTLVPLRMVSELLDCDVNWNGETRKIDITSKEPENKISEPLPQENVSNKENSEPEITDNREISNADYISISDNTYIMLGQRIDLNVKSKPSGISAKNLKLTSSDENIIKVYDDGTVEGVALGTATVTATAGNGKFSNADIEVTEFHFTDIKDTISFKDEAYLAPVLQITGTKSEYKKSADSYILSIAFQCYLSRSTDADATLKWDLCDKDGFVFESKETKIESSEHISGEKFEKKVTVSNLPAGEYYLDVR